ncbi:lipopolysaccharide biosynthesis protein [Chryseobacterium sp. MMS23-Vi53]|uniref:lipopolysaccharide biosynthesis protein n=1 Tax=Chryseobacterium sp. MMS23-Vi53 TaxID=3386644 RepID=UPI0039E9022D
MLKRIKSSLFFKNFSIYFIGLLISGLISFVTIPIITQKYTVAVYGKFSLIQNVILILISFGGGWINQCVIRFNDNSTGFKINIYQIFFTVFIPLSLISLFIILFLNNNIFIAVLSISTFILGGLSALGIVFYQSNFKAGQTLALNLIRASIFAGTLLFFVLFRDKIDNIFILIVCFFLSFAISILPLLKKEFKIINQSFFTLIRRFDKRYISNLYIENKRYFDYGWPLALWFTISTILNVGDRYVINMFETSYKVGVYSSIYDILSKSITMICSPILIAGFPMMSRKFNEGRQNEALKLICYLLIVEITLLVFTIFFVGIFKEFFLNILGVEKSAENFRLLIPLVFSVFLWQFAMLAHKPLELYEDTKFMLFAVIVSVVCNFGLNMFFIPKFGIVFAAYSSMLASVLYLLLVTAKGFILFKKNKISS